METPLDSQKVFKCRGYDNLDRHVLKDILKIIKKRDGRYLAPFLANEQEKPCPYRAGKNSDMCKATGDDEGKWGYCHRVEAV